MVNVYCDVLPVQVAWKTSSRDCACTYADQLETRMSYTPELSFECVNDVVPMRPETENPSLGPPGLTISAPYTPLPVGESCNPGFVVPLPRVPLLFKEKYNHGVATSIADVPPAVPVTVIVLLANAPRSTIIKRTIA